MELREPRCRDKRECFARENGKCTLLTEARKDGKCSFCKEKREYTNGVYYPYIPMIKGR